MQKLSLNKRRATIGGSINTRTQRHGKEELHPALDIPLAGMLLTPEELGEILGDPGSYETLFTKDRSKFAEPRWPHVPFIPYDQKFKGAKATLTVDGIKLIFKPATIQKIRFFCVGEALAMSCTMSAEPPDGLTVDVLDLLNKKCDVTFLNGQVEANEDQSELGLEGGAEEGEESAIGRKIRRATSKRK